MNVNAINSTVLGELFPFTVRAEPRVVGALVESLLGDERTPTASFAVTMNVNGEATLWLSLVASELLLSQWPELTVGR